MANRFHKLKGNESDFPLINTVDVYQFDNDFDYQRYTTDQMNILMCTVPWDMGEAHIGARTISGIGNVVHFGSAENRDAWFAAIPDDECYRFATKYKELHRDGYIDVPVPFDVCAKFNYIAVSYSLFANDESPVMYEHDGGVRKWFWFIREVEFLAANNTRLHLMDDAFQTWIYDVDITGMILERGHAPMFEMKADEYLANPLDNNTNLLTEDVNYGDASIVKHMDVLALNAGDMYACIATSANPRGTWGSKANDDWHVPVADNYTVNGQPSYYVFAVPVAQLNSLLANINSQYPQFRQTVQGVFFASADLITLGSAFTFAGVECRELVSTTRKTLELVDLEKAQFGYGLVYADIAKLYTSPYAHIEITNENGNVDVVRIEDTTGQIDVSAALSVAYPYVTIDAHLLGVGGTASATVTYRNVSAHTFNVSGQWYETLRTWNVPVFAVMLSPALEYDYATHFDREQREIDYNTAFENANASATTSKANADAKAGTNRTNSNSVAASAKANADASALAMKTNADAKAATTKANSDLSADTAKTNAYTISDANKGNADDSADLVTDNADLTTVANDAIANISNGSAGDTLDNVRAYNFDIFDSDNAITDATATSQIQAQEQQAAISAASGAISSAVGAISSAASGNVAGAVSSAVNGIVGAASTLASSSVSIHLTAAEASIAKQQNEYHAEAATTKSQDDTATQQATTTSLKDAQNTLTTSQAANSAATTKGNALRTNNADHAAADATQITEKANNLSSYNTETINNQNSYDTDTQNNLRTYTTETDANERTYQTALTTNAATYTTETANAGRTRNRAIQDIENDIAQAALRSPIVFGEFANGESAANKPMALFANIVTQSKAAISAAGDEFLRYGYRLDKQWDFNGNWNIGKYFTYWKLRDFWVSNLNVPDMYMDKLRFFLYGGVTIWRSPEDIGKRTIYENFN